MNQILLTENSVNKNSKLRKNNEIPPVPNMNNRKTGGSSEDIKKIIIFFAVALIVLGIAIIAIFAIKGQKKKASKNGQIVTNSKPEVSITYDANSLDEEVAIYIKSDVGIDYYSYSWDDDEPNVTFANGTPTVDQMIDIPLGVEVITVEARDINGQVTTVSQDLTSQSSSDKPTIEEFVIEGENGKQLKIVAESQVPIKYIKYKWNDEEEHTVEADGTSTTFETIIDIKLGNNDITVVAVDENDAKETYKFPVITKNNPVIDVTKNGDRLYMKSTHDKGFKSIEYDINGQKYVYDNQYAEYDPELKEVEFSFGLKEGENTVIITATSNEDSTEIYRGKCTYSLEEE